MGSIGSSGCDGEPRSWGGWYSRRLYVVDRNGNLQWNKSFGGSYEASAVYGGDLCGDGGDYLLVGGTYGTNHIRLDAASLCDGSILWTFDDDDAHWSVHAIAACDVNGDGIKEVFIYNRGNESSGRHRKYQALNGCNGTRLWECVLDYNGFDAAQALCIDVNSDGVKEVLLPVENTIEARDGLTGALVHTYTFDANVTAFELASIPEPAQPEHFADDFEDGSVDPALWVTHGYKGGIGGVGAGDWQHSETEQTGSDGYFEARVWGPTSGNTFGAEAWIRTVKDFNDGREWLLNFTWETSVSAYHVDNFAVQIADGTSTDTCNWHQYAQNSVGPGWVNLWQSGSGHSAEPTPPFAKQTWSVKIEPVGTAYLYTTANAQGTPYQQMALDGAKPWHLRFLINDATSAGYPAGDNRMRLYSFGADTVMASPMVFVGDGDSLTAYGLPDSNVLWTTSIGATVYSVAVVPDGNNAVVLACCNLDQLVNAYDARTGSALWSKSANEVASGRGRTADVHGQLYTDSVSYPSGPPRIGGGAPVVLLSTHGETSTTSLVDSRSGVAYWDRIDPSDKYGTGFIPDATGSYDVIITSGPLFTATGGDMYRVDGGTGATVVWSRQFSNRHGIAVPDVNGDGQYDLFGAPSYWSSTLHLFDGPTGQTIWSQNYGCFDISGGGVLVDAGGCGVIATAQGPAAGGIRRYRATDGTVVWDSSPTYGYQTMLGLLERADSGLTILSGWVHQDKLVAVDAATGQALWDSVPLTNPSAGAIGATDLTGDGNEDVLSVSNDWLRLYDGLTGAEQPGFDPIPATCAALWLASAPQQYALTVEIAGGNGTCDPSPGAHDYDENTVVDLLAMADPGYRVKAWTGTDDDSLKTNENTVTMTGNKTVTVEFEVETFDLTVNIIGGHGTCVPMSGTYAANAVVDLLAQPVLGWQIKAWTGTDDDLLTTNENTITMSADQTVMVEFELAPWASWSADFDGDNDVDLTDFAGFTGCFNGPNRPPAVFCAVDSDLDDDGDVDLADFAIFAACFNGPNRVPACPVLTYSLEVTVNGEGSVSLSPDGGVYAPNVTVTLVPEAAEGWLFIGWSGDLAGSDNPGAILMDTHKAVTALFVDEGDPPPGMVLFSEDFNVDPTASWTVNDPGLSDVLADFHYDYSAIGVPAAPNGTGTRGLKMTANNSGSVFSGFSVSPNGQSFSGDYKVSFDMWQNYVGPLGVGGSGTAQLSMFGVGTAGNVAVWVGSLKESVAFGVTLDGGSASDFRAYSSAAGTSYPSGSPVYNAPSTNGSDPYYAVFGSVSAPAAQVGLFAGQTGSTDAGETSFRWARVEIDVSGDLATWSIDGTPLATIDLNTVTLGGGNIFFGHGDTNMGSSIDPNDYLLNVTLIDNIEVVREPAPAPSAR